MNAEALVSRVLDDEGLAGDLGEKAAAALIGWAVKQAEQIAARSASEKAGMKEIEAVCRRARAVAQAVSAMSQRHDIAAAGAIVKKENLPWPPPDNSSEESAVSWLLSQDKRSAR